MRTIVFFLLCAVVVLGVVVIRQNSTIDAYSTKLATISAETSAAKEPSKSFSVEIQAKCSEQARIAFVRSGLKESEGAVYQNHYNSKLNKCFIETENHSASGKTLWTYRNVYDAFEGRQYGTYAWHTEGDKKYWEVAPTMCEVESLTGARQICHSDEEFSVLIKSYMVE